MKKFLYIINYSPHEHELCEMELRQIFHEDVKTKLYFTDQAFDFYRSPFIRGRMDILAVSRNFEDCIKIITEKELCYERFKVIYLKNETTHVHYQETIEKCQALALPIAGSVDLHHPKILLALTKKNDEWIFGRYEENRQWHKQSHKPYQYSQALNFKDARALVNIAIGTDIKKRAVDPCCGIGTVVLEALSMNIDIKGYDINPEIVKQAQANLDYYGYKKDVISQKGIDDIDEQFDIVMMDIPYGVFSPFSYQQQLHLIDQAKRIAPKLLLISHTEMHQELKQRNYDIKDSCMIQKAHFTRYIYLCEVNHR